MSAYFMLSLQPGICNFGPIGSSLVNLAQTNKKILMEKYHPTRNNILEATALAVAN